MDIGAADLTVILAAGAAGHQAVTEIDQTAQGNKRQQNGVLQGHRMGNAGLLFQNGGLAYVRPQGTFGVIQKNRPVKVPPFKLDIRADLTIVNRNRCFMSQFYAGKDQGLRTKYFTAGGNDDPIT